MSKVLECPCGARILLDGQTSGQSLACPQCNAGIPQAHDGRVLAMRRRAAGDAPAACPICQTALQVGDFEALCPSCKQVHHRDCWTEVRGCGSYGCAEAPQVEKTANSASAPPSAWGDTKACPVCGESIKAVALRCRYCQTDFHTADPLTLRDIHRKSDKSQAGTKLRNSVATLFAVSVLGCAAPIVALIGIVMIWRQRAKIVKEGPVYLVLCYTSVAISALYTLLFLLFTIF